MSPLSEDLTLDHRDPNGGDDDTNLVTACRSCNSAKGNRPVLAVLDRGALLDTIRKSIPRTTPEALLKQTCGKWGLSPEELLSASRSRHHVRARADLAHELRKLGLSFADIARLLNRNDHSTIVHLLKSYPQPTAGETGDRSSQSGP
jgi:chromosomal replication initiation ATPase DnaA